MSEVLISVVLPVKNGMPFLKESIESILKQTENRFKLIIIDDHSNDNSVEYIKSLNDERVILHKNTGNGLVDALNLGLSLADTEFIARMDADDISFPERFERQLEVFQKDRGIMLIGTWYEYFSKTANNISITNKLPVDHKSICLKMEKAEHAICHPSIMIRKKLIDETGFYDKQYFPAEDYDLFFRASEKGKLENIPMVLHKFRITENSIFSKNAVQSILMYSRIRNKYVRGNKSKEKEKKRIAYSIAQYRKGLYFYLNYKWFRAAYYFFLSFFLTPGRGLNFIIRNIFKSRN